MTSLPREQLLHNTSLVFVPFAVRSPGKLNNEHLKLKKGNHKCRESLAIVFSKLKHSSIQGVYLLIEL